MKKISDPETKPSHLLEDRVTDVPFVQPFSSRLLRHTWVKQRHNSVTHDWVAPIPQRAFIVYILKKKKKKKVYSLYLYLIYVHTYQ